MDTVYSEETNLAVSGRDAMGAAQRAVKRAFDFAAAFVGLVVLSPLFLVIYVLLKRQKNGPVIFSQERIGYGGRPFTIYKFRTMSSVETAPRLTPGNGGPGSTATERFLNVLKGDMSFVGPRPERKYYIDKIMAVAPEYELIYLMRPGLTSEATLYNGYTDTMEKMLIRLRMDLHYLETRSLRLDLSIILRTALSIVSGKKF